MTLGITDRSITPAEVESSVAGPDAGAVVTFAGLVRDATHGRRVLRLEYEAYAPMAERVFAALITEARSRWPILRVAISHRVGVLQIGEVAVAIAVASAHRAEAFEACRFLIAAIKAQAPIWKREVFEDGSEWAQCHP